MASSAGNPKAYALSDWESFISYFARQCRLFAEAGGRGFIAFGIPCECCSYVDGIALMPFSGDFIIFANFVNEGEVWVELWKGPNVIIGFTVKTGLGVEEDIFGSALTPAPFTPLGLALGSSTCLYEHAAIRLVAFMATALEITPRQASDAFAHWNLHFHPEDQEEI